MIIPIQARSIRNTLLFGYRTITLLLGTFGILFGLGFLLGDSSADRYYPFLVLFDPVYWSALFCAYGLFKFYQAKVFCSTKLRITNSVLGAWLWAYSSISFLLYDPSSFSPSDALLMLPLAYEIIELIIDLFQHRNTKSSARFDV